MFSDKERKEMDRALAAGAVAALRKNDVGRAASALAAMSPDGQRKAIEALSVKKGNR